MSKLGYRGDRNESDGKLASTVYRDAQGRGVLTIADDKVMRGNEVVARNAVDLVIHIREAHERTATTPREAIAWLAEKFGKERAVAASVVRAEQGAMLIIREHERSREIMGLAPQREPPLERGAERPSQREPQREQYDGRSGFSR